MPDALNSNSFFSLNKSLTFITLCLSALLLLYVKKTFIEYETAAFEFLQDRPEGAILRLISTLQFVSIPVVFLWKFSVIGMVLWFGCFLFGYRITFSQCWSIVMAAEFVFILPEIIKILWFLFIDTDPAYQAIHAFYPLSLMNFFNFHNVPIQYHYPLKAISLFELGYIYVMVRGVHFYSRRQQNAAWYIVCCSYIFIYLLWLIFYMVVYK